MTRQLPEHLQQHAAFRRVFQPGRLTIGLIAPFKPYPDTAVPDIGDLAEMAKIAEDGGVSALWVRDVPFFDPSFGDVGQGHDVAVTLGYLAAVTKKITLGTAGYISPLRNPVLTAKEAASADRFSGGRLILGLSSGDRPSEYPAFNQNFDNRAERFRENWHIIRTLTEQDFPVLQTQYSGQFSGSLNLEPKPFYGRLPMVTIGRARQDMSWFATESDAWIWHGVDPAKSAAIIRTIETLGDGRTWHPFGYANFVDILEDADAPVRLYNNIYLRGGAKGLVAFWKEQEAAGVAHICANLKPTSRPPREAVQDFVENVVSHFLPQESGSDSLPDVHRAPNGQSFDTRDLAQSGGFGEQFRQAFRETAADDGAGSLKNHDGR